MELKFSRDDVKTVLEGYYREYEDFDGVVNIDCRIGTCFERNETFEDAILSVDAVGKLNVFGIEVPMVRKISESEVKNVFRTAIELQGYTVSTVTLDYGITRGGYRMNEVSKDEPYFNGVKVSVKNKTYVRA